jgi:hypothetical protein
MRLQESASRLVRKVAPHQAMTVQHTTGVLVDDEDGAARPIEQDGIGRLRPDPGNPQKILAQGAQGQTPHGPEAPAKSVEQPRGERAQAPGLETEGAGRAQGAPELVPTDESQTLRAQQAPGAQGIDGTLGVCPRGELHQDGAGGDLVRRSRRPPVLGAEPAFEGHVEPQQPRLDNVPRRARDAAPACERRAP